MEWSAEGYIIGVRSHGETSAIIEVLTRQFGRHAGLVRGGRSRRLRPVLQIGNKVKVSWRARLSDHLGAYTAEALDARAAQLMQSRLPLTALSSLAAICQSALPERQAYPAIYDGFEIVRAALEDAKIWPALYVRFEAALLDTLGYGLDLSCCAATGETQNLTHVSPRTGRAVSHGAAQPYLNKLLPLPGFLNNPSAKIGPYDIENGLALTGYFLQQRLYHSNNMDEPAARQRMVAEILRSNLKNREAHNDEQASSQQFGH